MAHAPEAEAPDRRETTSQRIRVGMTGLAIAFLLILLGSIVSRSGRDEGVAPLENAVTNQPKEPLAELGVAPAPEAHETVINQSR